MLVKANGLTLPTDQADVPFARGRLQTTSNRRSSAVGGCVTAGPGTSHPVHETAATVGRDGPLPTVPLVHRQLRAVAGGKG